MAGETTYAHIDLHEVAERVANAGHTAELVPGDAEMFETSLWVSTDGVKLRVVAGPGVDDMQSGTRVYGGENFTVGWDDNGKTTAWQPPADATNRTVAEYISGMLNQASPHFVSLDRIAERLRMRGIWAKMGGNAVAKLLVGAPVAMGGGNRRWPLLVGPGDATPFHGNLAGLSDLAVGRDDQGAGPYWAPPEDATVFTIVEEIALMYETVAPAGYERKKLRREVQVHESFPNGIGEDGDIGEFLTSVFDKGLVPVPEGVYDVRAVHLGDGGVQITYRTPDLASRVWSVGVIPVADLTWSNGRQQRGRTGALNAIEHAARALNKHSSRRIILANPPYAQTPTRQALAAQAAPAAPVTPEAAGYSDDPGQCANGLAKLDGPVALTQRDKARLLDELTPFILGWLRTRSDLADREGGDNEPEPEEFAASDDIAGGIVNQFALRLGLMEQLSN